MTPESEAASGVVLAAAGLPADTPLIIFGRGRVRHVKAPPVEHARRQRLTWCNMFWSARDLRDANYDADATLPICGGCLRSYEATLARIDATDARDADEAPEPVG